jgi:hypothetical protein
VAPDDPRTLELNVIAREALADPDLRVDVVPERYGSGHRVTLCIRVAVSFRVPGEAPLSFVRDQMRMAYVTLAEGLRDQLKLRLNAMGTTRVSGT